MTNQRMPQNSQAQTLDIPKPPSWDRSAFDQEFVGLYGNVSHLMCDLNKMVSLVKILGFHAKR